MDLANDIDFKSLFCIDIWTVFNGILPKDFMTYRDNDCIKYICWGAPLSLDINPRHCNLRFYNTDNHFHLMIDKLPLPDFKSVIFSAMSLRPVVRSSRSSSFNCSITLSGNTYSSAILKHIPSS